MDSFWPSNDDLIRGMDVNHDDIVDFLRKVVGRAISIVITSWSRRLEQPSAVC